MGSKSKICDSLIRVFPKADNFYDLFGGGFSVTHAMLKRRPRDFKQFHFNELRPGICELIKNAIAGRYNYAVYQPPWISREEFFEKTNNDPMVKIIWSFGNNGSSYLFGKDIEQAKKSMHMAIVFNEFDEYSKNILGMERFSEGLSITDKRLYLKNRVKVLSKNRLDLQQLQQLQQLERLEFYSASYEMIPIKENSVIYCDIPYAGTAGYDDSESSFSHKKFFDWAAENKNPVFISEYDIKDNRFKCIANFKKRSLLSSNKDNALMKTEKVYVNGPGYRSLFSRR